MAPRPLLLKPRVEVYPVPWERMLLAAYDDESPSPSTARSSLCSFVIACDFSPSCGPFSVLGEGLSIGDGSSWRSEINVACEPRRLRLCELFAEGSVASILSRRRTPVRSQGGNCIGAGRVDMRFKEALG